MLDLCLFKLENFNNTAKAAAQKAKEELEGSKFVMKAKAGDSGKLFGSITAKEIAESLEKNHGVSIDKRKITIPEPIKSFGKYELDVKLYNEVNGKIHVLVTDK